MPSRPRSSQDKFLANLASAARGAGADDGVSLELIVDYQDRRKTIGVARVQYLGVFGDLLTIGFVFQQGGVTVDCPAAAIETTALAAHYQGVLDQLDVAIRRAVQQGNRALGFDR